MIDRERIEQTFREYVSAYDPTDQKIALKIDHTFRVADLCEQIAASIGMDREDREMARTVGMLHDVGRFEQIRIYGTFNDAISVNHAEQSVQVLFREGRIGDYIPDADEETLRILEKGVEQHNRLRLEEGLTEREKTFCNIVRDADKLDILMLNTRMPHEVMLDVYGEEPTQSRITPEVYDQYMAGHCIDKNSRRTSADRLLSHVALAFELVYPFSRQWAAEKGYVMEAMNHSFEDPETQEQWGRMKRKMERFLGIREEHARVKKAREYFLQGYNCSQSVFAAFADRYGISEEMALKMTSTLGAGFSAMREVCGAVSGISLVCGLEEGNSEAGTSLKKASYEANRRLMDRFSDRWGSIICREILEMKKLENRQAPSERTADYYAKRPCLRVVETAAAILSDQYDDEASEE